MKKISILGSTGTIGTQTLDVIATHTERFQVTALSAGHNVRLLMHQIEQFRPSIVSVATEQLASEISVSVPSGTRVLYGQQGMIEVAAGTDADMVVTAVTGSIGLKPTLAAIEAGKKIGLANKETLVTAGSIVMNRAKQKSVQIIPIDSEHSAIFQCLQGESIAQLNKMTLTASGGAFRHLPRSELKHVTVEDALQHPNWSMGAKITIDSATMVNKGMEVIEAHWLFGIPYEQIDVVLHPQSIVHSMVQFQDTSIIAQLGVPDMRIPIQYALTYPDRLIAKSPVLNIDQMRELHFAPIDDQRFPCLKMAYECGKIGGTLCTAFNAANEIAVHRFLRKEIPFLKIEDMIKRVLDAHDNVCEPTLQQIDECDQRTRKLALHL